MVPLSLNKQKIKKQKLKQQYIHFQYASNAGTLPEYLWRLMLSIFITDRIKRINSEA